MGKKEVIKEDNGLAVKVTREMGEGKKVYIRYDYLSELEYGEEAKGIEKPMEIMRKMEEGYEERVIDFLKMTKEMDQEYENLVKKAMTEVKEKWFELQKEKERKEKKVEIIYLMENSEKEFHEKENGEIETIFIETNRCEKGGEKVVDVVEISKKRITMTHIYGCEEYCYFNLPLEGKGADQKIAEEIASWEYKNKEFYDAIVEETRWMKGRWKEERQAEIKEEKEKNRTKEEKENEIVMAFLREKKEKMMKEVRRKNKEK